MSVLPRIALIHALRESLAPIDSAFEALWPEARRTHLLDDSLSADLAAAGVLDDGMTRRFLDLATYVRRQGADAILFTCSAFGPCIDAVKAAHPAIPVLKPNEAMLDEATAWARQNPARPLGLLATFGPTLASMPPEFPADVALRTGLAASALAALQRGDGGAHDALANEAAAALAAQGCGAIALAQFSLARAAPLIAQRCGLPVFTTPQAAVRRLRQLLGA